MLSSFSWSFPNWCWEKDPASSQKTGSAFRETFLNPFPGYHHPSKAAQLHIRIIKNPKQIMRERSLSYRPIPGHKTNVPVGNLYEHFWCLFLFWSAQNHLWTILFFPSYLFPSASVQHRVRIGYSTWILLWGVSPVPSVSSSPAYFGASYLSLSS